MSRPPCMRRLGTGIESRVYKPAGVPARDMGEVVLGFDEAEALRLADLQGLYQDAAALSMGVSRQTFGRIVEGARRKVADAILNGKALLIEEVARTMTKGEQGMKIAVPSRDGIVDEHFGHCKEFMIFDVEPDGGIAGESSIVSPEGCGCKSGIAAELARMGVTDLVAGNMGDGAVRALSARGIKVLRGASGPARAAAQAFARGELSDAGEACAGHGGEGHECSH
ncbi:MAG: NifB/NifX family molybdenum-iron cluster-binding protein [Rectinemataceae bacterium]